MGRMVRQLAYPAFPKCRYKQVTTMTSVANFLRDEFSGLPVKMSKFLPHAEDYKRFSILPSWTFVGMV